MPRKRAPLQKKETNTRGKEWEELIEIEHLLVHNQGRIPTFESKNGKSIIDVTLSHRLPYTLEIGEYYEVTMVQTTTQFTTALKVWNLRYQLIECIITVSYTHLTLPTTPYV